MATPSPAISVMLTMKTPISSGIATISGRASVTAMPASTNTATIAPSMNRSPWAKLMSWRTP